MIRFLVCVAVLFMMTGCIDLDTSSSDSDTINNGYDSSTSDNSSDSESDSQLTYSNDDGLELTLPSGFVDATNTFDNLNQQIPGSEQMPEGAKAYTENLDISDKKTEIPIGVSCRTCDRLDCSQRAFPPLHKKFDVDINARGVSVYVSDK